MRDSEKSAVDARLEVVEKARKLEISADAFPPDAPWTHFPWEAQLRPRSECEDALRQAIGLRDLSRLSALLAVETYENGTLGGAAVLPGTQFAGLNAPIARGCRVQGLEDPREIAPGVLLSGMQVISA